MARFDGRTVVITGAGSGIGKEMAALFADEGAHVVCSDRNGTEEETASFLGTDAIAVHADVSREADVRHLVEAAEQRFGRLDVMCNNAGFGGPRMPLADQSLDNFDTVHAVNLTGVFLGMKYAIQSMLQHGGGCIVNTASATGLVGWKHHSIYAAAKAGVVALTKCAALDYAELGIRVNAICPGPTWTGLVPASKDDPLPPPGARAPFGVPMGRWGLAIEQAKAAVFLASDDAAFITGVALPVDGGGVAG